MPARPRFAHTVQEDDEGINPTVKVWNLDKTDRNKLPLCARTIKIAADAGVASPVRRRQSQAPPPTPLP